MHTVDQLREQMSLLREAMRQDLEDARERVAQEVDYRRQVRRYPLASCAGALLAGYLLASKKRPRHADGPEEVPGGPSQETGAGHERTHGWASVLGQALAQSAALAVAEHFAVRTAQSTPAADQPSQESAETAERAQYERADAPDKHREAAGQPSKAAVQLKAPVDQLSQLALVAVRRAIKRRPGVSLLAAACAGICAGWLIKRK
jgi:hypothetical protein